MNKSINILVTGANGQIGTELVRALRLKYSHESVIASDLQMEDDHEGMCLKLDVMDAQALFQVVNGLGITHIYHLAAALSANGEKAPLNAWNLNMQGLLNILEVARLKKVQQVFWPSSIAVFGPDSPKAHCPQDAITIPATVYGISKCAGEYWCQYYNKQYGLDIRSLRYPGLISHSAPAGGGTTDYAVAIFHEALNHNNYTCYLEKDTMLPMMYMPDAVRATMELMDAPAENLTVRTAYNLAGFSFTPEEIVRKIRIHLPDLQVSYKPDFRQQIADSWPASIADQQAKWDWGWQPDYDLSCMVTDMLKQLENKKNHHQDLIGELTGPVTDVLRKDA